MKHIILFIVGFAIFGANPSISQSSYEAHLKTAYKYLYEDFDDLKAIEACTKAIQINPNEYLPYYYRAYARRVMNFYEDAIPDYSKAIDIAPSQYFLYEERAQCYHYKALSECKNQDNTYNHDCSSFHKATKDFYMAERLVKDSCAKYRVMLHNEKFYLDFTSVNGGWVIFNVNKYSEMEKGVLKNKCKNEEWDFYEFMGRYYEKGGYYEAAFVSYEKAVKFNNRYYKDMMSCIEAIVDKVKWNGYKPIWGESELKRKGCETARKIKEVGEDYFFNETTKEYLCN